MKFNSIKIKQSFSFLIVLLFATNMVDQEVELMFRHRDFTNINKNTSQETSFSKGETTKLVFQAGEI